MGVIDNQFTQAAKDAENTTPQSPQPGTLVPGNGTVVQSTPAAVTQVSSAVDKDAEVAVSSLQSKVGAWLKDVYSSNKFLFYTIIPLVGLIYLVLKFHNILIDLLLGGAKQEITQAQQTDAKLAQQADATKAQADALVQQANNTTAAPVDPDWDKK